MPTSTADADRLADPEPGRRTSTSLDTPNAAMRGTLPGLGVNYVPNLTAYSKLRCAGCRHSLLRCVSLLRWWVGGARLGTDA